MAAVQTWQEMRDWQAQLLEQKTGEGVAVWNRRIAAQACADEAALRAWLGAQGVTGYA
jgi:hypothetical protein